MATYGYLSVCPTICIDVCLYLFLYLYMYICIYLYALYALYVYIYMYMCVSPFCYERRGVLYIAYPSTTSRLEMATYNYLRLSKVEGHRLTQVSAASSICPILHMYVPTMLMIKKEVNVISNCKTTHGRRDPFPKIQFTLCVVNILLHFFNTISFSRLVEGLFPSLLAP